MNVRKVYYSIWTDGIQHMQKVFPSRTSDFKFATLFCMTFGFGMTTMIVVFSLSIMLKVQLPELNIDNKFLRELLMPVLYFFPHG